MQTLAALCAGEQNKLFRDKVAKTSQYLAKILLEYAHEPETKKMLSTLASNISMGRRIYRWGQITNSTESLLKLLFYSNPQSMTVFLKQLILSVSYFLNHIFDMLCYLYMLRVQPDKVVRATFYAQLFYFIVCFVELVDFVIPVVNNVLKLMEGKRGEDKKKIQKSILDGVLNSTKRIGDGITALKDVVPSQFEGRNMTVNVGGFLSGFIAVCQAFPGLYKK